MSGSPSGNWQRRSYELPSARLVQAEREVYRQFGDLVSVNEKAKSLLKFGKSASLTTGSLQTVWTNGGNETYVEDNLITQVSSSNAADTQLTFLEGHTVTGVGVDQKFTFISQSVVLDGQNTVNLPTPLARTSRAYNTNGTNILGNVTFYETTPVVGGVPTDTSKVHLEIPIGFQQSFKGATTISDQDYYFITGAFGSVSLKQSASVDFYLEIRPPNGVFRQAAVLSTSSSGGPWDLSLDPVILIPKNSDIRVRVEAGTNGAVALVNFKGYLAKVIG
jgi:hypothetical protein